MEVEVSAEAKDKKLNRTVAMTVVTLSVFTGLCNIKDGNIVQAMQAAQAASVDRWNEYQASRTKLHIAENTRMELTVLTADPVKTAPLLAELDRNIAKYREEGPKLAESAKEQARQYDALNVHDDQFDASEALISTAISLAAVGALCESFGMLFGSWTLGIFGMFLGVCGFAKWGFHPDVLSNFLG